MKTLPKWAIWITTWAYVLFLVAATLNAYNETRRLLTADNSDGFIPGEAGAAALIAPWTFPIATESQSVPDSFTNRSASSGSVKPFPDWNNSSYGGSGPASWPSTGRFSRSVLVARSSSSLR